MQKNRFASDDEPILYLSADHLAEELADHFDGRVQHAGGRN